MSAKQLKIQIVLGSEAIEEGEAFGDADGGTESRMVTGENESLAVTDNLMLEVLDKENLKQALLRVMKNKGSAGIDRITVDMLPAYLKTNWKSIRMELLNGTYAPLAVRRVEIPKGTGGMRQLGIPSVIDRFIQQALQQVLQRHWDHTFSKYSFGFRPGKSQHQAIQQAQKYVSSGSIFVVDIDLEKFFDRVNHDILMSKVAKRVKDKRVLKVIRAFLNAGVMENGLVSTSEEGVPQGGPLSPLLSNLMLDDLDRELEKRKLCFVRYADDCNIYVSSKRAGERVMQSITRFLGKRLRLRVNEAKSAVDSPWRRKFLGFSFTSGQEPKRRIAPASLVRFKEKIKELTLRKRGNRLIQIIGELAKYMRGWLNYYGFCETPSVLANLEKWIRRRLRCLIWKRWKRGSTRFAKLRAMGLNRLNAREGAGNGSRGPWRMARTPPVQAALSNAYFRNLGLPELVCFKAA